MTLSPNDATMEGGLKSPHVPLQHADAHLPGYEGPWFPMDVPGLARLQIALDATFHSRWELKRAVERARGSRVTPLKKVIAHPKTVDLHKWEIGFVMQMPNGGETVLLIAKCSGGFSQRHCALYTKNLAGQTVPPLLSIMMDNIAVRL